MKVVVTGAKGMLGSDLVNVLTNSGINVVAWDRNDFDITNKNLMKKLIDEKPDFVINCAAYTNVDLAETEKDKCLLVNTEGVKNIVDSLRESNSVFVQISTDYVFDGNKESYIETDKRNPINQYGLSKALAEEYIEAKLKNYYIIRTSWLFGKNGKNFVDTISNLSNEKNELKVVNDQIGCPTYTVDLSKAIASIILKSPSFGVYHITNSGKCSWFEFAKKIVELNKSNCNVVACTTQEYPRPAKRPIYSVLENNKFNKLPNWQIALKEYMGVI